MATVAQQVIHYHGLPITPDTAAVAAVGGGHAFVSFAHPGQLGLAMESCQSFALDNGAFSAWTKGEPVKDWGAYYEWCADVLRHPACDFAIIPDVIGGAEAEQDRLIDAWTLRNGVPVWHMDESLVRLTRLCYGWPRVAIGSTAMYASVGSPLWWDRIAKAMNHICINGLPPCKLHGLRMLDDDVFTRLPFSSADSTNIGRNVGIDCRWSGPYTPPTKQARALLLRQRIEANQSAQRWEPQMTQETLCQSFLPV